MGGIPQDGREIRGEVGRESHIPGKKPGFTQMDQFLQNFIHIQRLQLGFGLSGKGEEVFNRIGQPVQLRFDDFESISIFGLEVPILQHELNIAGDRVQGGSDLMGHRRGDLSQGGQFFRLTQLSLGFEQGFVEKPQFFISFGQFRGGGFDFSGQLLIELVDL